MKMFLLKACGKTRFLTQSAGTCKGSLFWLHERTVGMLCKHGKHSPAAMCL